MGPVRKDLGERTARQVTDCDHRVTKGNARRAASAQRLIEMLHHQPRDDIGSIPERTDNGGGASVEPSPQHAEEFITGDNLRQSTSAGA